MTDQPHVADNYRGISCPVPPESDAPRITLAHGEGGRLSRKLLEQIILPVVYSGASISIQDAAHLSLSGKNIAFCTDSHTVTPIFFPGGDLGSLSVYGTINDLAVSGAVPRWLSLSLILEEGLPISVLRTILESAASAAGRCDVQIVTGDTKVVPRGAVDGIFINTAGIGEVLHPVPSGPETIVAGDHVVVSGPLGQHGMAVLLSRQSFLLEPVPSSDSAPLIEAVAAIRRAAGSSIRAIRDATRGGVSAVLHEWATDCRLTFELDASRIPVSAPVRSACELLGLDPLHVANEGLLVAVMSPDVSETVVRELHQAGCPEAAVTGTVVERDICPVTVRRIFGTAQPLDEPSGAPLPRIC